MKKQKLTLRYFENKKLKLEITKSGFSLWDVKAGRWIIDASLMKDGTFAVSNEIKKHYNPKYKWMTPEFSLFHPKEILPEPSKDKSEKE